MFDYTTLTCTLASPQLGRTVDCH